MKIISAPIQGDFVSLRLLVPQDAELTFSWRVGERAHLLNRGALTVEDQVRWITSRPKSELNFMIEDKKGLGIGMLSLIDIDEGNKRAESARFLIGNEKAAKGTPAAVESMKLLYELAFDVLSLSRIYGTVASENKLMIKWQKYLGMKEEGCLRKHYLIDGKFQDAICLGILADEFHTIALPKMKTLIAIASKFKK